MMKMKRILSVLLALLLVCSLFPTTVFAASASFSLSGSGSVTLGNQVKVTVKLSSSEKIGSWRFSVKYDPAILEYVSGADSGGGGAVSFADSSDGITSLTKTITFRTKKIGNASVSVGSAQVVSFDSASNMTVNAPSKKISVVAAPDLSTENNLSGLSVSTGELTPAFAAGTTAYTLTVPYEITSLAVYATAKDGKAKVSVTPSDALAVGENKIDVVVTAENGSKRTYTITVTRQQSELAGVTVDLEGKTYNVAYDPATLTVPEGYTPSTVAYGDKKILVFSAPQDTLRIAYLSNDTEGAWYIYDVNEQNFSEYFAVTAPANTIVLLTPPQAVEIPEGFLPYELTVGDKVWSVYKAENSEEEGIWLVYGMKSDGTCEFFYYDSALSTFSSYFEPVEDKEAAEAMAKEQANLQSLLKASEQKADQMEILFLGTAALATLLLIGFIIALATRKKGKAEKKSKKERKKEIEVKEASEIEKDELPPAEDEAVSESVPVSPKRRRARRTLEEIAFKEPAPVNETTPVTEFQSEFASEPEEKPQQESAADQTIQTEEASSAGKMEPKHVDAFARDDIPTILR